MKIKRFRATDFRNIGECDIELSDGVNLLVGENAQGKTNCVEGIYLFSRGRSFRGSDEKELLGFGKEGFRLILDYEDKSGANTLEYAVFGKERLRKKNGYRVNRMSEFIGCFKSVLFYPDNLSLVKGGPEERRAFLNVAISQCYPDYVPNYSAMKQSFEERNNLIKAIGRGELSDTDQLFAWSYSLAEYSSHIFIRRREYMKLLSPHVKRIAGELSSGSEEIQISHKNDIRRKFTEGIPEDEKDSYIDSLTRGEVSNMYLRLLTENTDREIKAGTTLYSPTRDDIAMDINGLSSRVFASQGQQRSIALAMKLAEGEVIRELFGEYPVYLFDDVLSELDSARRAYIIGGMEGKQIIITSCERSPDRLKSDRIIEVKSGGYR